MTTRLLFLLCGLYSLPLIVYGGWSGFPISTLSDAGDISSKVQQLMEAASERYSTNNNFWTESSVKLFNSFTSTVEAVEYYSSSSNWVVMVTNYYQKQGTNTSISTGVVSSASVSSLLRKIDSLVVAYLANNNVADCLKMKGGSYDNYFSTPVKTTNWSWNGYEWTAYSVTTSYPSAGPVFSLHSYIDYITDISADGKRLIKNIDVVTATNSVYGYLVGKMFDQYAPSVVVISTACVLDSPRRLRKEFTLGETEFREKAWKTPLSRYPSEIDMNYTALIAVTNYTCPKISKLIKTSYQRVRSSTATNDYPLYNSWKPQAGKTNLVVADWKGVLIANNRMELFTGLWDDSYATNHAEWILYSLSFKDGAACSLQKWSPIFNNVVSSCGNISSDFVFELGWEFTPLESGCGMNASGMCEESGYKPSKMTFVQGSSSYSMDLYPQFDLELVGKFYKPAGYNFGTVTSPPQFSVISTQIVKSAAEYDFPNSCISLSSVSVSNNWIVTNYLDGTARSNVYLARGSAFIFSGSNTYNVFIPLGSVGAFTCPEQLNARYYLLKNLNDTWESGIVKNERLQKSSLPYSWSYPQVIGYPGVWSFDDPFPQGLFDYATAEVDGEFEHALGAASAGYVESNYTEYGDSGSTESLSVNKSVTSFYAGQLLPIMTRYYLDSWGVSSSYGYDCAQESHYLTFVDDLLPKSSSIYALHGAKTSSDGFSQDKDEYYSFQSTKEGSAYLDTNINHNVISASLTLDLSMFGPKNLVGDYDTDWVNSFMWWGGSIGKYGGYSAGIEPSSYLSLVKWDFKY